MPHYLVIDVEATCAEDRTIPRDKMEIIEIGAVLLDDQFAAVTEFASFVKPVRTHKLTQFCTELTTITQQDVDSAPYFAQAMEHLIAAVWRDWDAIFCSWGAYDKLQFQQDCRHHGVPYPFGPHHENLKNRFAAAQDIRRCGVKRALAHVGLTFQGTHHRGIDDARNIARLLPYALR